MAFCFDQYFFGDRNSAYLVLAENLGIYVAAN